MTTLTRNNFAYIDGANLHKGAEQLGWPVTYLLEKEKLETILSPAIAAKCSILLKRTGAKIAYINDQRSILAGV